MNVMWRTWMVGGLLLGTMAYAVAEDITLTTYYPSPRGVYEQIVTTGQTTLATNGGNVGIGTTSPSQRLALGSGNVLLPTANQGTSGNLYFGGITDSGQTGLRLFGGLVNGTSPAGFIDVRTTDPADGLRIRVDTVDADLERMRITASGNVGIGTSAPAYTLHIGGGGTIGLTRGGQTGEVKVAYANGAYYAVYAP